MPKKNEQNNFIHTNMKRYLVFIMMLGCILPLAIANDDCEQRLTREEFRTKQQAFIAEKAGLTQEEADKFFPLYFELQDEKKKLNDEAWKQMRQGRNENATETDYEKILESVNNSRIASAELEKEYFDKFKKILSCKKIYQVQQAEMRFHRKWLKDMRDKAPARNGNGRKPRK